MADIRNPAPLAGGGRASEVVETGELDKLEFNPSRPSAQACSSSDSRRSLHLRDGVTAAAGGPNSCADMPRRARAKPIGAQVPGKKRRRKRRRVDATGRSIGDGKHVRLYRWVLRSLAWRSLSLAARCLLVELYDLYNGENNGELFLSVREAAARLRTGKDRAHAAIRELEDRGFIRARQRGSFDYKSRHATQWVLTEFPFAGQLPTKDFMRWSPPKKENPVPVARTNGPCGRDSTPAKEARQYAQQGP